MLENSDSTTMKKISAVILAISFLFTALGCSEKTTNEIQERNGLAYAQNETEPFTGILKKSYPNGQKELEFHYKDGKRDGLRIMWHENGKKEWEWSYKNGKQDGLQTSWYENGQKEGEFSSKNDKFDGLFALWYENGQKKAEANYIDGEAVGLATGWYENGKKKSEENRKDDGKQNGLQTRWYENGQKEAEANFKDGVKNGLETRWFQSGQKKQEQNFKDGKPDGLYKTWYENGQQEQETNVKDGMVNGLYKSWYENGQKEAETNFKDGVKNGLSTKWYANGQKEVEGNFKDGKPDGLQTVWFENGLIVEAYAKYGVIDPKTATEYFNPTTVKNAVSSNGQKNSEATLTQDPNANFSKPEISTLQTLKPSDKPSNSVTTPKTGQGLVLEMLQLAMDNGGTTNEVAIQQLTEQLNNLPKKAKGNKKLARDFNSKGHEFLKINDFEKAGQMFKEAHLTDPSDIEVVNNLGYVNMKMGDLDSAETNLIESLALSPNRATAWENLGDVYAAKNESEKAIASYANMYRFSKNRLNTHKFMNKLNSEEDVEKIKKIRSKAVELASQWFGLI